MLDEFPVPEVSSTGARANTEIAAGSKYFSRDMNDPFVLRIIAGYFERPRSVKLFIDRVWVSYALVI